MQALAVTHCCTRILHISQLGVPTNPDLPVEWLYGGCYTVHDCYLILSVTSMTLHLLDFAAKHAPVIRDVNEATTKAEASASRPSLGPLFTRLRPSY